VLGLIPPPLRDTRCVALLNNMAARLDKFSCASKGFDAGPGSAARLAVAATAYSDALEQLSEWGAQLKAAADEAQGATAH
jgi:hypothetical protein